MLKGIEIRIYPNAEQAHYLNRLLGCCRFLYNQCLEYRTKTYQEGNPASAVDALKHIVALKEEYPFLKDVHSKVLQQSVRNLNRAFDNFFKQRAKYPQFKSKKDNEHSCRFPKDAFIGIRGNRIDLIKTLKDIHFKCSRRDEKYLNKRQDCVHSLTLRKTSSGKYFISILIDYEPKKKKETDNVIGLDLGIKDFIVDSNGVRYENKHFYKNQEKKIKKLSRRLAKKQMLPTGEERYSEKYKKMVEVKKPSKNREKARIKLAKLHEKITNQRKNYIHELTSKIVDENQVICVEDLNVKGMMHNHKLAKHIQDAGFGEFVRVLEYKCKMYGRTLVKIDRFYPSSKTCSHCGAINKHLKLSDREWVCTECGAVIDRDFNAAVNILNEGLRQIDAGRDEFART